MALFGNRVKNSQSEHLHRKINFLLRKNILICVTIASLVMTKISAGGINTLETSGNIHKVTSGILGYINTQLKSLNQYFYSIQSLKLENQKLQQEIINLNNRLIDLELLENHNIELKELLNFVSSLNIEYISTKLLSIVQTTEGEYGILDCGKNQGIDVGSIVVAKDGLIGKIVEVSSSYAKVLMITNSKFRMPIMTASGARGILAGDAAKPYVLYLENKAYNGEMLFTSGDGGILIKDIPVARISNIAHKVHATPSSNLYKANFVSILKVKSAE